MRLASLLKNRPSPLGRGHSRESERTASGCFSESRILSLMVMSDAYCLMRRTGQSFCASRDRRAGARHGRVRDPAPHELRALLFENDLSLPGGQLFLAEGAGDIAE